MITLKSKHKGMQLGQAPQAIMMLGLIALLIGAVTLAISAFSGTLDAGSAEKNVVGNGSKALLNLSLQMPTVGTIVGVALIIGVVIGAFYVFGEQRK